MFNYMVLMQKLYSRLGGTSRPDRTNTGTASIFDHTLEYDLRQNFPLLPYREINFKDVVVELLWFLRGESNIKFLEDNGCKWWSEQCDEVGEVGPMYGAQWRGYMHDKGFRTPDQFRDVIDSLRNDPFGRRHVIDSWRPESMPGNNCTYHDNVTTGRMAIAPCHQQMQFYVEDINGVRHVSVKFIMRSSDTFLGLPANIASYGLLLHIVAGLTGYKPYREIWSGGDVHLYSNHEVACGKLIDQWTAMVKAKFDADKTPIHDRYRGWESKSEAMCPTYVLPQGFHDLVDRDLLDFKAEGLVDLLTSGLCNYHPGPVIKARMAR